ncbi:MAG: hypothetical protein ACE5ET_02850 [Gammaproteobacteria bacterium]
MMENLIIWAWPDWLVRLPAIFAKVGVFGASAGKRRVRRLFFMAPATGMDEDVGDL